MGAIQRPAEIMPPSWFAKMGGGPDILQRGDSTGAIHDRCGNIRDTHEQNKRGGVQLD